MLLLYSKQIGGPKVPLKTKERIADWQKSQRLGTDLELEMSAKLRHTRPMEEISHLRQTYHLERRFLQ